MKSAIITLNRACIGYRKEHPLLPPLTCELREGTLTGLVGVNGTGKSTLLRTIGGLQPLLDGHLQLCGKDISAYSTAELPRKISVVLTGRIGGFNLTVFDAVAAGQMPYTGAFHRLEAHHRDVIERSLDSFGLTDLRNALLHEISDGQYQKTMVARAMCQQCPVMLLDEPTAFLDYRSRHELFGKLRALAASENKCIIVSTHDLDLVLRYCDEVLMLSQLKGEFLTAAEARNSDLFRELGGGFLNY